MTTTLSAQPTTWLDVVDAAERAARRQSHRWPGTDAADIAQEVLFAYFRHFGDDPANGPDNLHAWMQRAVRNEYVDAYRRRHHRGGAFAGVPREKSIDEDSLVEVLREASSTSVRVMAHELFERVLGKLEGREREVFERRIRGEQAAGLAEDLGMSRAAVDQAYARAKRRLRLALEADAELLADLRGDLAQYAFLPRF